MYSIPVDRHASQREKIASHEHSGSPRDKPYQLLIFVYSTLGQCTRVWVYWRHLNLSLAVGSVMYLLHLDARVNDPDVSLPAVDIGSSTGKRCFENA
jgi:hypothetical protein